MSEHAADIAHGDQMDALCRDLVAEARRAVLEVMADGAVGAGGGAYRDHLWELTGDDAKEALGRMCTAAAIESLNTTFN